MKLPKINCIFCNEYNLCELIQSSVLGEKCVLLKEVLKGHIMTCRLQQTKK